MIGVRVRVKVRVRVGVRVGDGNNVGVKDGAGVLWVWPSFICSCASTYFKEMRCR